MATGALCLFGEEDCFAPLNALRAFGGVNRDVREIEAFDVRRQGAQVAFWAPSLAPCSSACCRTIIRPLSFGCGDACNWMNTEPPEFPTAVERPFRQFVGARQDIPRLFVSKEGEARMAVNRSAAWPKACASKPLFSESQTMKTLVTTLAAVTLLMASNAVAQVSLGERFQIRGEMRDVRREVRQGRRSHQSEGGCGEFVANAGRPMGTASGQRAGRVQRLVGQSARSACRTAQRVD